MFLVVFGVTSFYTGMALGVDTWAAMDVLALRERNWAIKLHCILPCEGQEIMWTVPAQVRYKYILGEADSVEYVKRLYDGKCMLERNQRLVDSAGILLAVYNGEKRPGLPARTCRKERPEGAEKPRRQACSTGRENVRSGVWGNPNKRIGVSKRISRYIACIRYTKLAAHYRNFA